MHEPSSCKKPGRKLGLQSCKKKPLRGNRISPSRSSLENIPLRFTPSAQPHIKGQRRPQRQQNLTKGKLGRISSPPAAFQLRVNHRSRGDEMMVKNHLLTYTQRSAGKNPWPALPTNKQRQASGETEQGGGHQGTWAF